MAHRPPQNSGKTDLRLVLLGGIALLAIGGVAVLVLNRPTKPAESPPVGPPEPAVSIEELRPQVTAFCGNCHGTPSPAGFPRGAWHEEVKKGYNFYLESGRGDLSPPAFNQMVAWFRQQAPEEIVVPRPADSAVPDKIRFRVAAIAGGSDSDDQSAVSFVKWCSLAPNTASGLLWCDMRSGAIRFADPLAAQSIPLPVSQLAHPAHAEPCDLDGDGLVDLVVADLGSFQPADHAKGKVVWLRRLADGGWEPIVIQSGLGRVADVQPGDFDADGDLDLVVAEFGWRKTGRILLLENRGPAGATPEFRMHEIDPRHGTIHVPPVDLDGDGRLDFIALISQEHETVVAFLNDGAAGFRRETIFAAGEPAFGSSGIQLVDLDRDGDLDVLYTNGDTFDSFYPKPFHSIRWLENRGGFPFADRELAIMPGVHRALAGDLDGDGDLDLAACALLPVNMLGGQPKSDFDSLIWLEQTGAGRFERHSLERETCQHAAMEMADFDGDGDLDLAVGQFGVPGRSPALSLWWNLRIDAGDGK